MSARYSVDINVFSNSYAEDGTFNSAYKAQTETFSGLVQTEDMYVLQNAIDTDKAVPLDDYLADNAVWNALPESIKSTYKVNGHIYAIPSYVTNFMHTRIISKDASEQTGINVTDLDSLKEFCAAYSELTGNYAINSWGNQDINDILNAFGLYSGQGIGSSISYDPTEGCYVDFLTKGAAADALEYLRELNADGGLNIDFRSSSQDSSPASPISVYGLYNLDEFNDAQTLNPQYPQVLFNQVFGFYMTKDTAQPQETINFFIDLMFGSEQNYLDCWLGSSDGYTLNSDGTITVEMVQNSDGSYIPPARPNLVGGFSNVFPHSDADLLYSQDGVVTADSVTEAGKKNQTREVINNALSKGIVVKILPAYTMINCPAYYTNYFEIGDLYQTCIEDALTATNWTVQQIIDDYKEAMLNMGGNKMLDEMNAAIGKQTAYYYG